MTDKQIIIDGVDVSGCAHYDKNADKEALFLYDCKREHAPYWSCTSMPNCLYKKYKRKEQECERLKSDYFTVIQQRNIAEQQLDQLKQTLTEIKEIAMGIMDNDLEESSAYYDAKQILQKISECEEQDGN